jgi:transposase-like protein
MKTQMKKKPHSADFKFRVAIEAIRGEKTTAELCAEFGVASSQIFKWKKAVLEGGKQVFAGNQQPPSEGAQIEKLHATIGRLTVENNFLEKCVGRSR